MVKSKTVYFGLERRKFSHCCDYIGPRKIVRREHTYKLHSIPNSLTFFHATAKCHEIDSAAFTQSSSLGLILFFKRFTYFILKFSYDLLDVLILFIYIFCLLCLKTLFFSRALSVAVKFESPPAKWVLCARVPIIEHRLYFTRLNWDFHLSGFLSKIPALNSAFFFNWIV